MIDGCKELNNKKLQDLYSSRNINRVVTLKEDEMMMRVACMSEIKTQTKLSSENLKERDNLGGTKTALIGCSGNEMYSHELGSAGRVATNGGNLRARLGIFLLHKR